MPLELKYKNVRDLAKRLRDLTGRDIKHTQILAAIAESVGRRPDAMMHELKGEAAKRVERPHVFRDKYADWAPVTEIPGKVPRRSVELAAASSLGVWSVAKSGLAFGRIVRESELPDGSIARLGLMVTEGDFRIDGDPDEDIWQARLLYSGSSGVFVAYGTGIDGYTLREAVDHGLDFLVATDVHWEDFFTKDVRRMEAASAPRI